MTEIKQDFSHDKKVMVRYVQTYTKKNGEKALAPDTVEDIVTAVISCAQTLTSKDPRAIAKALIELGGLVKKYGAKLIDKLYHNFRKRQQQKEKAGEKVAVPPTQKKLQQLLKTHELDSDQTSHEGLKEFFALHAQNGQVNENRPARKNATLLQYQAKDDSRA